MNFFRKLIEKFSSEHFFPEFHPLDRLKDNRNSDYGMIITSIFLGIGIGIFVALFHLAMEMVEVGVKAINKSYGQFQFADFLIIPFIAAFGGLMIGILKKTLFQNATIENLNTVVSALVFNEGKIDWRNSIKSIIYAALSIGTGGGAGREGPTIVLGASLGSTIAQILRLKPERTETLCGAGAAAAISAIFNAPIGGIIFASEAIIGDLSIRSFVSLVVASVFSTATTRFLAGDSQLLVAPAQTTVNPLDYLFLSIAGILSGFVALYFLKSYKITARIVSKKLIKIPELWKPAIGGFMAGTLVVMLPTMLETTYSPINNAIAGNGWQLVLGSIFEPLLKYFKGDNVLIVWLLAAGFTIIIKPISNAVTLASGGAGGTFAPSIKAGVMFGFCFGILLDFIFPNTNPGLYAIVCGGAVLAGTYQAPLAGGIILFEISKNYDLILPLVLSSVFASFIIQKSKVRTFNALQKELVDDDERMHPVLNIFRKINQKSGKAE